MNINPFISLDEQLERIGWHKFYENEHGFRYTRKIGVDVIFIANFNKYGIRFYDDPYTFHAIDVSEITLKLFAAKIKEWRRYYGRTTEGGLHYSKERS